MDYPSVVRIQTFSALGGGDLLLAAPQLLLWPFAIDGTPHVLLLARLFGGVLFALAATLAAVRDLRDVPMQTRVCVGNAVCDGCIALFVAVDAGRGALGPAGQSAVVRRSTSAGYTASTP